MPQTQLRLKIRNVRQQYIMYAEQNTTYAKHQVHQTKTKYANQNTKYAKQNTKYAKQNTKYSKQNTKYAKQKPKEGFPFITIMGTKVVPRISHHESQVEGITRNFNGLRQF